VQIIPDYSEASSRCDRRAAWLSGNSSLSSDMKRGWHEKWNWVWVPKVNVGAFPGYAGMELKEAKA